MKKFVASDLLGVLRAIVETNTKHHQEDFDMDIKTLQPKAQGILLRRIGHSYGWCVPVGHGVRGRGMFLSGTAASMICGIIIRIRPEDESLLTGLR